MTHRLWHDDPDSLHDGIENYTDIPVVHPDDTPYHDDDLMAKGRISTELVATTCHITAVQAWLDGDTLDYFLDNPDKITEVSEEYPIELIRDEGDGNRFYLLNGNHRIVAARILGQQLMLKARIITVSDPRTPGGGPG